MEGYVDYLQENHNSSSNESVEYSSYYYDDDGWMIPAAELVTVSLVYGLAFLLGISGNILVFFTVYGTKRMQTVTNIFLTNLACADLMLILICIPVKLAKWFTFTWTFGEALCKIVHYIQTVSIICSVINLMIISIERYYAILHPIRAKCFYSGSRSRRVVAATWVLALLLALPIIPGQVHKKVGVIKDGYWCIKEWASPVYGILFEVEMLLVILVIPLAVMVFTYTCVCRELWLSTTDSQISGHSPIATAAYRHSTASTVCLKANKATARVTEIAEKRQVIKMLVAVLVIFTICWAPTILDNLLVAVGVLDRLHYGYLKYMRQAFVLMSYSNSCINPIVYAFMSQHFRRGFKMALCTCVRGKSYFRQMEMIRRKSMQTRMSSTINSYAERRSTF